MSRFRKLSQTIWHCQYHLVWVPKYRFRILTGEIGVGFGVSRGFWDAHDFMRFLPKKVIFISTDSFSPRCTARLTADWVKPILLPTSLAVMPKSLTAQKQSKLRPFTRAGCFPGRNKSSASCANCRAACLSNSSKPIPWYS